MNLDSNAYLIESGEIIEADEEPTQGGGLVGDLASEPPPTLIRPPDPGPTEVKPAGGRKHVDRVHEEAHRRSNVRSPAAERTRTKAAVQRAPVSRVSHPPVREGADRAPAPTRIEGPEGSPTRSGRPSPSSEQEVKAAPAKAKAKQEKKRKEKAKKQAGAEPSPLSGNAFRRLLRCRGAMFVLLLSFPLLAASRVGSVLYLTRTPAAVTGMLAATGAASTAAVTPTTPPPEVDLKQAELAAAQVDASNKEAWDRALVLYSDGDLESAIEEARRSGLSDLGRALEAVQNRYYAGRAARTEGKMEEAIAHMRSTLALDAELSPTRSEFSMRLRRELSRLHVQHGRRFLEKRQRQRAFGELRQAVELDRSNRVASQLLRRLSSKRRGKFRSTTSAARSSLRKHQERE